MGVKCRCYRPDQEPVFASMAMIVAAFGFLQPVTGALVQEGIDIAVILNALRTLGGGRRY